ncbi:transposase [Mangrovivirga cuniculi]|uniref:Transposase n=1 Tax=Mangrovivirga cuniculi TaxID=2715131 RepID=A0A4D7JXA7_9BACT|nr:transposase [Mangrovivirga cuniculi]
MKLGEIYFWTASINKWQNLLLHDGYKEIIIDSLGFLSSHNKIDVFSFVIMPNHIHLIWRINEDNGKESVKGSFLKYTAHQFKKKLLVENSKELNKYKVKKVNKSYEFWQRDPLAVPVYSIDVINQKLDYIHNNPVTENYALVQNPADYKYSSARYYLEGINEFSFLKDIRDEL